MTNDIETTTSAGATGGSEIRGRDSLTGLSTVDGFRAAVQAVLNHPGRNGGGAAFEVSLDNLRSFNVRRGWSAGDDLLRSVSATLRDCVPGGVTVSRLDGDRFAMVVPHWNREDAEWFASTVVELISASGHTGDAGKGAVTASVGIALLGGRSLSAGDLMMELDLATSQAKSDGRNRFSFHDIDFERDLASTSLWAWQIRDAIETDSFRLLAQPVREPGEKRVRQWELLVRLTPRDGELMPPAKFFPIAARFGLLESIDYWVVRRAIVLLNEHAAEGRDVSFEVNVTATSVADPSFVDSIEQDLVESGLDPSRLILEISESAAIVDIDEVAAFAARLKKIGCRIVLDNFGSAAAPLVHLTAMPLDFVKLDGRFVRNLASSPRDQEITSAIVHMAHALSYRVIAAMVPDRQTAELLERIGVDQLQGFCIGPPGPTENVR